MSMLQSILFQACARLFLESGHWNALYSFNGKPIENSVDNNALVMAEQAVFVAATQESTERCNEDPFLVGKGICHDHLNTAVCRFNGRDCCQQTSMNPNALSDTNTSVSILAPFTERMS